MGRMDRNHDGWPGMDYGTAGWGPRYPFAPPVYRDDISMRGNDDPIGKIGFSMDGEIGRPWEMGDDYRMGAGYQAGNKRTDRSGGGHQPLTREKAEAWVAKMENSDGSTGAHWTMEQTKQLQSQKGIGLDPIKFWVAMNMMYSDYATAAEKAGVSTADFYADLAKAFLVDKDAMPDKLDRYYCAIVKR